MNIDQRLLDILVCPSCHTRVRIDDDENELVCDNSACGLAYPVRDDIPVMLIDQARSPGASR